MEPIDRQAAYRHDICYVAGKELVFDYLKDRLAGHGTLPARVTRLRRLWLGASGRLGASNVAADEPIVPALHFAIVDEADSVLIDEARTPMILSRETPGIYAAELLQWAVESAQRLERDVDFRIGAQRDLELLPGALDRCDALPDGVRGAWRSTPWRELMLRQALCAIHLFLRDQHYILVEGKVQIVDESTGRVMADRSWEQGLQQMIETKEGLAATMGRETMARMTFQRFFRRYFLLAGLTGTAAEASRELWSVYRLRVRKVPPNRPSRRARLRSQCAATSTAKWRAVADDACAARARGQPVLVGTRSVEASEQVAAEFVRRGVDHVVAQCAAGRGRSADRQPGRRDRAHHRRDQHGRPRHRHQALARGARGRRTARRADRVPRVAARRSPAVRAQRPAGRGRLGARDRQRRRRPLRASTALAAAHARLGSKPAAADCAAMDGGARTGARRADRLQGTHADTSTGPRAESHDPASRESRHDAPAFRDGVDRGFVVGPWRSGAGGRVRLPDRAGAGRRGAQPGRRHPAAGPRAARRLHHQGRGAGDDRVERREERRRRGPLPLGGAGRAPARAQQGRRRPRKGTAHERAARRGVRLGSRRATTPSPS